LNQPTAENCSFYIPDGKVVWCIPWAINSCSDLFILYFDAILGHWLTTVRVLAIISVACLLLSLKYLATDLANSQSKVARLKKGPIH
jgi:hypothetical protein